MRFASESAPSTLEMSSASGVSAPLACTGVTDAGAVARRVLGGLRLDAALYPLHLESYVPSHVDAPEPLLPATRRRLDDVYRGPNAALRRLAPDLKLVGWS